MSLIFDKFPKIYNPLAARASVKSSVKSSVKNLAVALCASLLASCQGSNLGSSLEGAIAPSSEPTNTPTAVPTPKPITKPTTSITPVDPKVTAIATPSPSPLASQALVINNSTMANLAKQALTKTAMSSSLNPSPKASSGATQILLKSLFYIDIAKFPSSQSLAPSLPSANQAIAKFQDIDQAPAALRTWIAELAQLGTISAKTGQNFQPNIPVARREYARWLLETNNRLYQDQPSRQIRLAQPSDRPSFTDIPASHPDFLVIQGLANAGLIATGDRFRPNDQLSREDMIQWKIPLDLRQPLPSANLNSINQSWGFQDSDRISESAQRAIFADAQLRDLSNIRRSFGFTTLLQPQKPVTRAEAAASLWYFGTATDGISAAKVLQSQQK